MHHHYEDIRRLTDAEPQWFDEHAVPRYCEFGPDRLANIYAEEACLAVIRCQNCGREFRVAFSWWMMDGVEELTWYKNANPEFDETDDKQIVDSTRLSTAVKFRTLHYGDPPNAGCCPAGPTMNSEPVRVLEFWRKEKFEFVRVPELEVSLDE